MSLQTLAAPARHALEARKSRFLALARRVDSPVTALDWLAEVADPAATHNCWAYRIGAAYRFSDDGEPGGSAGRPILAAIDGQGCDEVMVVVIRWYGGTNLGVGGLVRAYGGAAAECLRLAPKIELVALVEAELRCEFALSASVHGLLAQFQADKQDESFDEQGLRLRLRLPASMVDGLTQRLRDLSRGAARLHLPETRP
jgi:uncharacterized YigZ family protein